MTGIYKITNKINGHMYIGQSISIEHRWLEHLSDSTVSEEIWEKNNRKQQSHLHRAIRKYGKDNFIFEIIEECSIEELDSKEIYWIAYYNTFLDPQHYNMTAGGDGQRGRTGELSPGHKLTQEEANFIKEKLKLRWTQEEIQQYLPNVNKSTISQINYGKSWFDPNEAYPISINNGHRQWSDEEAMSIKLEYSKGASVKDLAIKYSASVPTIQKLISGKSYTNLPVLSREVEWKYINSNRKFTAEQVKKYRNLVAEGMSILQLYESLKPSPCTYAAFYNMIKRKTYKNIQ